MSIARLQVKGELMQSAQYLEVDKERIISGALPCDSRVGNLLGTDYIKLSITHPRGAVLFAEGQPAVGVFVLCAGRAKLSISSPEGKTLIVRIARAGDLLGVNSVLKGLPFEATVETLERCSIYFVSRADFISQLHINKDAWAEVSQALGNELSDLGQRARLLLLSRNTRDKLVRLLLEWLDDFGEPTPRGTRIDHGLTHEEIGQMICASRETVSRLFTELKRREFVSQNGAGIFVPNRAALEFLLK